jgi:hypothetical protein
MQTEGSQLKTMLTETVAEEEKMLAQIEQAIRHCDTQAEAKIWNMFGRAVMLSMDLKTLQIGMYASELEWAKRLYIRQIDGLMRKSAGDVFEFLSVDFSQWVDVSEYETDLKFIRAEFEKFEIPDADYEGGDVLGRLEIIREIGWSESINRTGAFEKIVNDMGIFLQKIIRLGLKK